MAYDRDNDLQRALERLTIQDVWRRAGLPDAPREGNIVVKSPLREDQHGKSFSIFKRGVLAKDQASGEVFTVFRFAEVATGLAGKELVDRLCEWANVTRTVHLRQQLRDCTAAAEAGQPVELPPAVKKLARRIEKQAEVRAAEDRLEMQILMARSPKVEVRDLHPWSDVVRGRYLEGWREMKGEIRQKEFAADRGWPVQWVQWLVDRGYIAMPWVPWTVPGAKYAQRGKAFRVDAPVFAPARDERSRAAELLELRHVGYHQRYFILGEKRSDGTREPSEKQWTYVPYMPAEEKQTTDFQREMVAIELARGGEIGRSCLAGVPFAIGDFSAPRLLVVSEGQWDAVTFAGAMGWLAPGVVPDEWGAAVMGVRGNEGADTMLAYWRPWLALHKPAVLVLGDNDAAGKKWTETEARAPGQPLPPTLADKFTAAGARRVHVARVRKEIGKDFNDYWKVRKPTPADMADWLRGMGFFDSAGGWA